jgi:hypothetical protein
LFDTNAIARQLEEAYKLMMQRYEMELLPQGFDVKP